MFHVQDTSVHILDTPPPVVGSARHSNVIPTIRFVAATPSNAGSSFESNISSPSVHLPLAKNLSSLPMFCDSPLAPSPSSRKRIVPEKIKPCLRGGSKSKSSQTLKIGTSRMSFAVSVRMHQLVLALTYRPNRGPQDWRDDHGLEEESRVALDGVFDEATSMVTSQTSFGDSTNASLSLMEQVPKKQSFGDMNLLKRSTGAASVLKSEDEDSK
jgi:hypothetical protein